MAVSKKSQIFACHGKRTEDHAEQIQAPIADRIRSYERYIASILHSDNAYVGSISDYILGNRGKQLRPLLVLLSAALHGEIGQRSYMGRVAGRDDPYGLADP